LVGEKGEERAPENAERGEGAGEEPRGGAGVVGAEEEDGDVVVFEVFGVEGGEALEEFGDERGGILVGELLGDVKEALFAEHGAGGIVGFDEGVAVAEDKVVGVEGHFELVVGGNVVDAQGDVGDGFGGGGGVLEEGPCVGGGAEEQGRGVAGVGEGEVVGGAVERGDDGGGEGAGFAQAGEVRVEGADKGLLFEVVDIAAHEVAQGGGGVGDGLAMAGDVGEEDAGDASGGAGGEVVDVAAGLGGGEGFGVDPGVEAGDGDGIGGEGVAAPDFHTGHGLWRGVGHRGIVAGWRALRVVDEGRLR
jgi:hypothetical protein